MSTTHPRRRPSRVQYAALALSALFLCATSAQADIRLPDLGDLTECLSESIEFAKEKYERCIDEAETFDEVLTCIEDYEAALPKIFKSCWFWAAHSGIATEAQ